MAQFQSAVSDLLASVQNGEEVDVVRESVRIVLQELIDAEAIAVIGADRYERSPERLTERNGVRSRELMTKGGTVELKIPKLRSGSFFPSVLERRRRIDQALYAVVMEAPTTAIRCWAPNRLSFPSPTHTLFHGRARLIRYRTSRSVSASGARRLQRARRSSSKSASPSRMSPGAKTSRCANRFRASRNQVAARRRTLDVRRDRSESPWRSFVK